MISHLRVTRTRGIFQQDFVGISRFGRTYYDVIIKSAKEDWHYDDNASIAENLIKIPINKTIDAIGDWFSGKGFNAVKMPKTVNALQNPPYFDVYGESLTRTIVDNNFKP